MLVDHDVVADIEAESRSLAGFFRGEKRVENPVLDVFWNSGSVVFDLDNHVFIRVVDPYRKTASSIHGIGGVVDDVGPCLVQLAAEGLDCRYVFVVFPVDLDALLQLAPEHEQGAVESFSDIDRLAGRLPDLFQEAADTCRPADEYGYRRRGLGAERFFELVEFLAYKPGVNQIGSDLPGVFDVAFYEPALQFVFDIAAVERVDFVGSPRGTGNFAEQCVSSWATPAVSFPSRAILSLCRSNPSVERSRSTTVSNIERAAEGLRPTRPLRFCTWPRSGS